VVPLAIIEVGPGYNFGVNAPIVFSRDRSRTAWMSIGRVCAVQIDHEHTLGHKVQQYRLIEPYQSSEFVGLVV